MDFTRAARRMDLLLIGIVNVVCKAVFQSKKDEGFSFGHVHFRHPLDVRLEVRLYKSNPENDVWVEDKILTVFII